ncbi:MAG: DUF6599 family protein [Acidobacteriota bacterium]
MIKRTAAAFLVLASMLVSTVFAADDPPRFVPGDGEFNGWSRKEAPERYSRDGLFGYINGGAEIFLEYTFVELWLARYTHGEKSEITLEVYRMRTPEDAFGIFSIRRSGNEALSFSIDGLHWISETQINVVRGIYYVNVTAFDTAPADLEDFTRKVAEHIPGRAGEPKELLRFPNDRRRANTGRFIRGRLAAVAESILFARDLWGFDKGTIAYSVRYSTSGTRVVLLFPADPSALKTENIQALFEEFMEDVRLEDGILSGHNAVGRLFLYKKCGSAAALVLGEEDGAFGRELLNKICGEEKSGIKID